MSPLVNPPPTSGAPTSASYVVLGSDATLTAERVLTAGTGVELVDAGAGSTLTVNSTASGGGITTARAFFLAGC